MKTEYDFVIYGATGYTGRLVAEYFHERYGQAFAGRWAIAGRDADRLAAARDALGLPADLPLIVAGSDDEEALAAMVKRTDCMISTVGPFQLLGESLLAACASAGTDYVDLCGEVPWMRSMIIKYGPIAKSSGARILFSCGFDSLPLEMGVFHHQNEAISRFGRPMNRVRGRFREMNGTFSGGTAESFRATLSAIAEDNAIVGILTGR